MLKNNKHNFHNGVVISTIGDGLSLTVGFEMDKPGVDSTSKDEGELSVAKRLITGVSRTYRNLVDVVVYNALACNSKWISPCICF